MDGLSLIASKVHFRLRRGELGDGQAQRSGTRLPGVACICGNRNGKLFVGNSSMASALNSVPVNGIIHVYRWRHPLEGKGDSGWLDIWIHLANRKRDK